MEGWQIAGVVITLLIILLTILVGLVYFAVEQVERDVEGLEKYLGVNGKDIPRHTKYNKEK